jgi:hypothetical protein
LGLQVPPPFFLGFFQLTLLTGIPFGVLWGICMWLLFWRGRDPLGCVVISALVGLSFGLTMAAYYRWKTRQLALPSWQNYPEG